LAQSVSCLGSTTLKKALLVVIAVVLCPILLIGLVAWAAAEWHPIGETTNGDKVSVSSVRVTKDNLRRAWVRVEYKEPAKLPQGGTFVKMDALVKFNCGNGSAVPSTIWFYSHDRGGKLVVSKKSRRDDDFGQGPEGGFREMTTQYVCQQKK
jgi:surface-adhesin protein E